MNVPPVPRPSIFTVFESPPAWRRSLDVRQMRFFSSWGNSVVNFIQLADGWKNSMLGIRGFISVNWRWISNNLYPWYLSRVLETTICNLDDHWCGDFGSWMIINFHKWKWFFSISNIIELYSSFTVASGLSTKGLKCLFLLLSYYSISFKSNRLYRCRKQCLVVELVCFSLIFHVQNSF